MKGVFTSLNRNSYFRDICLVYILSVHLGHRLLCQLANGVSKIPWVERRRYFLSASVLPLTPPPSFSRLTLWENDPQKAYPNQLNRL